MLVYKLYAKLHLVIYLAFLNAHKMAINGPKQENSSSTCDNKCLRWAGYHKKIFQLAGKIPIHTGPVLYFCFLWASRQVPVLSKAGNTGFILFLSTSKLYEKKKMSRFVPAEPLYSAGGDLSLPAEYNDQCYSRQHWSFGKKTTGWLSTSWSIDELVYNKLVHT